MAQVYVSLSVLTSQKLCTCQKFTIWPAVLQLSVNIPVKACSDRLNNGQGLTTSEI
jgi:hypothetical protein